MADYRISAAAQGCLHLIQIPRSHFTVRDNQQRTALRETGFYAAFTNILQQSAADINRIRPFTQSYRNTAHLNSSPAAPGNYYSWL